MVNRQIAMRLNKKAQDAEVLHRFSQVHTWTRATAQTIARSVIGTGYDIIPHPKFLGRQDVLNRDVIDDFLTGFNLLGLNANIADTDGISKKMMYAIASTILYGQFSWEIIRNKNGLPLGFYTVPGYVVPNVDDNGYYLNPAYYYRAWGSKEWIEFTSASDLFFFSLPGTGYKIEGESDLIAALPYAITSDIFASNVYKGVFENQNAPYDGYWIIDTDDPEEFSAVKEMIQSRYQGHENAGRNPIVAKSQVEFKSLRSRSNDDAPYLQGREYNQNEISAVTGVSSLKMGLTGERAKAFYREARKDFHENTLIPLLNMIEEAIYRRIIVEELGIRDFMLKFRSPELTSELERSSIYTRYIQNRIYTPNEIRIKLGEEPIDGNDELYGPAGSNNEAGGAGENDEDGTNDSSKKQEKPPSDDANPDDEDRN